MNFIFVLIIFSIILFVLINNFFIFENFSNDENRKIYNLFNLTQKKNNTLAAFKKKLNHENIKFGKNKSPNFEQYVNMLKKYNKNNLSINDIDKIRLN